MFNSSLCLYETLYSFSKGVCSIEHEPLILKSLFLVTIDSFCCSCFFIYVDLTVTEKFSRKLLTCELSQYDFVNFNKKLEVMEVLGWFFQNE